MEGNKLLTQVAPGAHLQDARPTKTGELVTNRKHDPYFLLLSQIGSSLYTPLEATEN